MAIATAAALDSIVATRVLVLGRFPPDGRDLDIVARSAERDSIRALLSERGFLRRPASFRPPRVWVEQWVCFFGCSAFAVDIHPPERWALPPEELAALFAEARPLDGLDYLAKPSPHHLVLLAARAFLRSGRLEAKQRAKIEAAVDEDDAVWQRAASHAGAWGLVGGLELLEHSFRTGNPASSASRALARAKLVAAGGGRSAAEGLRRHFVARRRRRSSVVALSGIDGSGKSSQATSLARTLEAVGVDAVIEWMPLGHSPRNPALRVLRRFGKKAVSLATWSRTRAAVPSASAVAAAGPDLDVAKAFREKSETATQLWSATVAVMQALQHRRAILRHFARGKVVIFDRFTVDSAAQLRYFYGHRREFRFQKWLIDLISPTPMRSFLLEVPPQELVRRKTLQYSLEEVQLQADLYLQEAAALRVCKLDGQRPLEELCEEIASDVWRAAAGSGDR